MADSGRSSAVRTIEVEHDPKSTGGYCIYTYPDPKGSEGFDDWVLDREGVARFFDDHELEVEWIDPTPPWPSG